MNTPRFPVFAVAFTVLASCASLRATTLSAAQILNAPASVPVTFQTVAFSDSQEAGMLHRAYHILSTGDHDYKGHRVRAMRAVKAAADLLGLDLSGDLKDREKQALSDERLREARGLLQQVLGSAEVIAQKKVVNHLHVAVKEINIALGVR